MITKEAKIILLGADNGIFKLLADEALELSKEGNTHMFFVTDEEPGTNDVAIQIGEDNKKVIATTDNTLDLPRPSIRFIKKYIELYNKGKAIDSVFVEYIPIYSNLNPYKDTIIFDEEYEKLITNLENLSYIPKINPKNNTIVIRKKVNDIPKDVLKDILLRYTERYAVKLFKEDYTKEPILFKSLPEFIDNYVKEL